MIKHFLLLCLVAVLCFGFTQPAGNYSIGRSGLKVGDKAPEIMLMNPEGDPVPLSSLQGKVVFIHFWASWCAPCRKENAQLVKSYEKFKDQKFKKGNGFVIYSVSLDINKNKWLDAIQKDGLKWQSHVSDLKGWESEAAKTYGVNALPNNLLVDADGTIVAIETRCKFLEYELQALQ
jgi:thiol-disulfide isomerase/thioredoxin